VKARVMTISEQFYHWLRRGRTVKVEVEIHGTVKPFSPGDEIVVLEQGLTGGPTGQAIRKCVGCVIDLRPAQRLYPEILDRGRQERRMKGEFDRVPVQVLHLKEAP